MELQELLNTILDFKEPSETDNENIYTVLMTIHYALTSDLDYNQIYQVYDVLGYHISHETYNDIWNRYTERNEIGNPYLAKPNDVELLNPDEPIPIGMLPVSTYKIPLDARVLYQITCTDKITGEDHVYNWIIDFNEGMTLNDTDELLREDLETTQCPTIDIQLIGGWSQSLE